MFLDTNNFSIKNKTKGKLLSLPFVQLKESILGEKYDLSLTFISKKEIHSINKKYRNVDSPTDILSFPLDKKSGEIFICQEIAKKKAPSFERNYSNFLTFLFIHGLVHLKGYDHGDKMEKVEKKYRKIFNI